MAPIRITIATPAEFFSAPEFDPLAGKLVREAGIDRLFDRLGDMRKDARPTALEIALPAAAIAPDTEGTLRTAIAAYCASEAAAAAHDVHETRRLGFWSLRRALPILALFLGLSTLATNWLHGGLGSLISNALIITGWVALWRPAELLLYDWWPSSHRKTLLDHLAKMQVSVVAG